MKLVRSLAACAAVSLLFSLGCDSEPESATSRGAARVKLGQASGGLCADATTYTWGNPDNFDSGLIPSGSGANVSCRVSPSGNGFEFDLSISGTAKLESPPTSLNTSVSIRGTMDAQGKGQATANFLRSVALSTTTQQCTVVAQEGKYAAGRMAATITCDLLSTADDTNKCAFSPAVIAFDNCAK